MQEQTFQLSPVQRLARLDGILAFSGQDDAMFRLYNGAYVSLSRNQGSAEARYTITISNDGKRSVFRLDQSGHASRVFSDHERTLSHLDKILQTIRPEVHLLTRDTETGGTIMPPLPKP